MRRRWPAVPESGCQVGEACSGALELRLERLGKVGAASPASDLLESERQRRNRPPDLVLGARDVLEAATAPERRDRQHDRRQPAKRCEPNHVDSTSR